MKEIRILIGNFGSGKTEIALNLALRFSKEGKKTLVIDLDRINDYFRMSDHIKLLEERKVNIVSPTFAGQAVTQSSLPAAVASAFAGDWDEVIFDVGGDPAGALSLARYHQDFAAVPPERLHVYDIVNVFRPMSESPEKILKLKEEMEGFARQKVTGFINNSNLLDYASAEDLRQGYEVLRRTSLLCGIPIAATTGRRPFLEDFLAEERDERFVGMPVALETFMCRSWDSFSAI